MKPTTWHFGPLRKISLEVDSETRLYYEDYTFKNDNVKAFFNNESIRLIGEVDNMFSLVELSITKEIFCTIEMEEMSCQKIAKNFESMIKVLNNTQLLWEDQSSTILQVNDTNLQLFHRIADEFEKENPGISFEFWEYQCFPGLNLGFPLA